MKVVTYCGQQPTALTGQVHERILDILALQLKVLQNMTTQMLVVPEGTRLTVRPEAQDK